MELIHLTDIKTVMSDNLNVDLKDNDGGFNCGKPAGFIQDFKALPEKKQELIKQIKECEFFWHSRISKSS